MNAAITNYFGIDFGTTNSATYGIARSGNAVTPVQYGDSMGRPIPSIVAINKTTGEVYTGRDAWNKRNELDESCYTFSSVKSVIDKDISYEIAGEIWTPVRIASELFLTLKRTVSDRTNIDMKNASVAIPVGMAPEKRVKIREAAQMAGISITSFVSEPTAAFLANHKSLKSCENVAVFDWGGGTLDCSVLKHQNGNIWEMASSGLTIAGDDIDWKMARRVHSIITRKKGVNIAFEDMPPVARDRLVVRCEQIKIAFKDGTNQRLTLNNYGSLGIVSESLDYNWFCEVIQPEVDKAIECLQLAIHQSKLGEANIDAVLLVGGSSNLKPLIDRMKEIFGNKVHSPDNKMWNIANGAAIVSIEPGAYRANQSVGILMSDNSYFELLRKDAKLKNWYNKCTLGITDARNEARFVFSGSSDIDESEDKCKVLELPTFHFLQEVINLVAFVDKDLVLTVAAGSSMRKNSYRRVWQYTKLKSYFQFPDEAVFV